MVWLLRFNLPDILLKLLLSFLCASFQLTLSDLQASFKLPAGFHLALLQASFELASSIPLNFLQAYLQLPSGLSLRSLWALPQNFLKLAWSFFQACFMFPPGLFRLSASFLQVCIPISAACFKHASSLLCASSKLPLSFFGACFELVLNILLIEKFKTLEPLYFALHAKASKAQSHKTLVFCVACKTFRTSKP